MHITMLGDGRLVQPLAKLATRAGNTVLKAEDVGTNVSSCTPSEMVLVTGERPALTGVLARVKPMLSEDIVVVDATTTVTSDQSSGEEDRASENEWRALLPSTRIVRAFASVPAEAFTLLADCAPDGHIELAVPFACDDAAAKQLVSRFMRQIGVEPFDLGPLAVSYVMDPGGPLWGKAIDALDMQEYVGRLSGDG